MRVVREFKCCAGNSACCACCRCCQMEVSVEAPVGEVIGYVRQKYVAFIIDYHSCLIQTIVFRPLSLQPAHSRLSKDN